MAVQISVNKIRHRFDDPSPPVFSISGAGALAKCFVRNRAYLEIAGGTFAWNIPNLSEVAEISARNLVRGAWTPAAGVTVTGASGTFTKTGADGASGASAGAAAAGNCSIEGKPSSFAGGGALLFQSGLPESFNYAAPEVEHALVLGAGGFGSIWERGVQREDSDFRWELGDRAFLELISGIVRYYLIKPNGAAILLRSKRSLLSYPLKPAVSLQYQNTAIEDVRIWLGEESVITLPILAVLKGFQDWQNAASWESLAEKTMNKDKREDFTYFTAEKNLKTLSINIGWEERADYENFLKFFQFHDLDREFLFVDAARHDEFYARFISAFKDNPLGADVYGISVDIRQLVGAPPVPQIAVVVPDLQPPSVPANLTATLLVEQNSNVAFNGQNVAYDTNGLNY